MSVSLKRRVGAVIALVVLFIAALPTVTYAKVFDDPELRFAAPGCPHGLPLDSQNWNDNFGWGSGVLGGVTISGSSYSNGGFVSFITKTEMKRFHASMQTGSVEYTFLVPSDMSVGDTITFIIPIKCDNLTYYAWTAGLLDSDGFSASYEFVSTVAERSNYLVFYIPGHSNGTDNDGNYYYKYPSSAIDSYCRITVTVTEAYTDTDSQRFVTIFARGASPYDAMGSDDYDNLFQIIDSGLSNPGVEKVGNLIMDLSSIDWVSTLIGLNVLLIIAAILINLLLSL